MAQTGCLIITDGRPYLADTLRSAHQHLLPYITGPTVIVTDHDHRRGLSGAIRHAWAQLDHINVDYIFHLEDDFTFPDRVPVQEMIRLLNDEQLCQVALKRQPVNPWEQQAGGFIEANPGNYTARDGWVESFFGFTLNPCVYPKPRWEDGWVWPVGGGEAEFTAHLRRIGSPRFGIFGDVTDSPRCTHIGHQRAPEWKL